MYPHRRGGRPPLPGRAAAASLDRMTHTTTRRAAAGRVLVTALVTALVAGGCTGGLREAGDSSWGGDRSNTGTGSSAAAPGGEDQAQEAAGGAGGAPSEGLVLDAQWYQDSDGNDVPDFIEIEKGYDPAKNDCAAEDCPGAASGDSVEFAVQDRNALLILDSSGSMAADAGNGQTKMDAAKDALMRYSGISSVFYQTGFAVFGHAGDTTDAGRAGSCTEASELLLPLGAMDPTGFRGVLSRFQPTGWTPIEGALREAEGAFAGKEGGVNRVILVSDGIETCGGDPVAAAARLHGSGIEVQIDVVGFGVPNDASRQLRDIAAAGGGTYVDARTGADLDSYFRAQSEAVGQTWDAFACELRNSTFDTICDQNQCNRATVFRIPEEQRKYDYKSPQYRALRALQERISDGLERRQQARSEAADRAQELRQQHTQLRDEYYRVFNQTYGR